MCENGEGIVGSVLAPPIYRGRNPNRRESLAAHSAGFKGASPKSIHGEHAGILAKAEKWRLLKPSVELDERFRVEFLVARRRLQRNDAADG